MACYGDAKTFHFQGLFAQSLATAGGGGVGVGGGPPGVGVGASGSGVGVGGTAPSPLRWPRSSGW